MTERWNHMLYINENTLYRRPVQMKLNINITMNILAYVMMTNNTIRNRSSAICDRRFRRSRMHRCGVSCVNHQRAELSLVAWGVYGLCKSLRTAREFYEDSSEYQEKVLHSIAALYDVLFPVEFKIKFMLTLCPFLCITMLSAWQIGLWDHFIWP